MKTVRYEVSTFNAKRERFVALAAADKSLQGIATALNYVSDNRIFPGTLYVDLAESVSIEMEKVLKDDLEARHELVMQYLDPDYEMNDCALESIADEVADAYLATLSTQQARREMKAYTKPRRKGGSERYLDKLALANDWFGGCLGSWTKESRNEIAAVYVKWCELNGYSPQELKQELTEEEDAKVVKRITGKVEAYGVRGLQSKPWRKTFANLQAMEKWLAKQEGNVYMHAFREVEEG